MTLLSRVSILRRHDMNSESGEEQKKGYHVRKSLNFDSKSSAEQKKVLIDFFIFILLSRESDGGAMGRTNPDSLKSYLCFQVFRLNFLLTSLICCLSDSTKQR